MDGEEASGGAGDPFGVGVDGFRNLDEEAVGAGSSTGKGAWVEAFMRAAVRSASFVSGEYQHIFCRRAPIRS